ncbi:hypothetical protein Fmac_027959 [Flemingia macrophylla]|uniref:Uncharacterized protein n=1 Tax=Flemingia macrophylla TaxID=520843 RepID=A0ABD1LJ85_9FABA
MILMRRLPSAAIFGCSLNSLPHTLRYNESHPSTLIILNLSFFSSFRVRQKELLKQ